MDDILKLIDSEENKFKSESWISNKYPDFHFFIASIYDLDILWKEKLFLYRNFLVVPPLCECGNNLKFIKGKYRSFCSVKCSSNSDIIKEKRKNTSIEKYGFDNPMKSQSIRDKLKESIMDKYGVDNASKLDSTKDKVKTTNNIKFGVDYISQLDITKDKLRSGMILRSSDMNYKRQESIKINIQEKLSNHGLLLSNIVETSIYDIICGDHHFVIHKNTLNDRIRNKNTICTVCNPINSSSDCQLQLLEYIKSNCDYLVRSNDRKIIGLELDVYIPDLNLAFEYNGIYWHSEIYKDKNYHINKTQMCLDMGIQLIHIWEDDWLYKNDIVKSRILNTLGKSKRVWARNCEVRKVSNVDSSIFLDNNHIQGSVISKIRIGLYHKGELLSIMTFGQLRRSLGQKGITGHFELLRFCNKCGISVVGGASKLFSFFLKNYEPISVISYADRCWSNGNLYKRLGFIQSGITSPNYYYVINGIRHNRFSFRKDILVKDGYDPSKSESVIMMERGYNKIFDSGNLKFTYDV